MEMEMEVLTTAISKLCSSTCATEIEACVLLTNRRRVQRGPQPQSRRSLNTACFCNQHCEQLVWSGTMRAQVWWRWAMRICTAKTIYFTSIFVSFSISVFISVSISIIPRFTTSRFNSRSLTTLLQLCPNLAISIWVVVYRIFREHSEIAVFEVKCVFWPVDWNWSGSRTNQYINFSLVLCGWCGQTGDGALETVLIFILAEGVFWHYHLKRTVWCKLFVNLVYTLTLLIYPSTWFGDLWCTVFK